MSARANHPFIAMLVRHINQLILYGELSLYYNGFTLMIAISTVLKQQDQTKCKDVVAKALSNMTQVENVKIPAYYLHPANTQDTKSRLEAKQRTVYFATVSNFSQILWEGRYLVDEGYGMVYPAEMKPDE